MAALSNEALMYWSIGVWVLFLLILGYYSFFGPTTKQLLPSGNTANTGNLASTS